MQTEKEDKKDRNATDLEDVKRRAGVETRHLIGRREGGILHDLLRRLRRGLRLAPSLPCNLRSFDSGKTLCKDALNLLQTLVTFALAEIPGGLYMYGRALARNRGRAEALRLEEFQGEVMQPLHRQQFKISPVYALRWM